MTVVVVPLVALTYDLIKRARAYGLVCASWDGNMLVNLIVL